MSQILSDEALERLARRSTADVHGGPYRDGGVPIDTVEAMARELLSRRAAMRLIRKYYPDVLAESWEDP
jgi:hypothetical protein